MTEPWLEDACALVDAFRAGTISPTEALDASLTAIEASDLNAFSHLDAETARATAASADVTLPVVGPVHQDGGNGRLGGHLEGPAGAVGGHHPDRQVAVQDGLQDGAAPRGQYADADR